MIGTGDHVSIGRLWIGLSLVLLLLALVGRLVFGIDLATDNGFLGENQGMLGGSSLVGIALAGVVPLLLGLATAIVPLQLGAPAIAFPRAAALALWGWLVSAGIFLVSVVLQGGVGGSDTDAARLGNIALGGMAVAICLGSICVATTVMSSRPAGMGLARAPLFAWSMLVASTIWILSLASVVAHVVVGQITQADATGLADNFANGIAWALRGPTVFMLAIPVLGIAAEAATSAAGRGAPRYGILQGLIGAYGVLSFGAWAQAPTSVETALWTVFALAVAVPVLGMLGGIGDLMRRGKVQVGGALVGGLLAVVLLLGAVVCGLLVALDLSGAGELWGLEQAELFAAQAAFVLGAALAGGIAGLIHWNPIVWGGEVRSSAASGSVLLVVLGTAVMGLGLAVEAVVQRDDPASAAAFLGGVGALGALLMLLGVAGTLAGTMTAARDGGAPDEDAGPRGLTLEWAVARPATGGALPEDLPAVTSPYPLLPEETD
jgi:cytochrome o ubiquinol oxidase subunit 1